MESYDVALKNVADFLTVLKETPGFTEKSIQEISWILRPGSIKKNGRLTCWNEGATNADFSKVTDVLRMLEAPARVLYAQQQVTNPFRQGIGISTAGNKTSYRLYLHGLSNNKQIDVYSAWRWVPGSALPAKFSYSFHYASSIDEVQKLLQYIPVSLQRAFKSLIAQDRFIQLSGYWLRRNEQDVIDQVDLTWPWHPLAGTLPGMHLLLEASGINTGDQVDVNEFPVRHIAFKTGESDPSVTLYTSADSNGNWPLHEKDLQRYVLSASVAYNKNIEEAVFTKVPELPVQQQNEIGDFYNGRIDTWKHILGDKMHYHAGFFNKGSQLSDEDMDQALDDAVTSLYPFLPAGGTLYDIGCGWGGPLAMIVRDLQCRAIGLTPSITQYHYISSLNLQARLGNAEYTLPPGRFDCILLLESFSHIVEKQRLLQVLKHFTCRLVMRVNCQDHAPQSTAFGGSMHMISSGDLRRMLEEAGWNIRHWEDTREKALPSVQVWHRRLQTLPPSEDFHIETLRSWTSHVLHNPREWCNNNPLIEVMAEC